MNRIVYKVATAGDWAEATASGAFRGSADDRRDGFIHLSDAGQLAGTLARHYRGQPGLVLAAFDAGDLGDALKWEPSRGGALFPHLYAALPAARALWTKPLRLGDDGIPALPEDIEEC